MTTVRIADVKPWPGERIGGRGFGIFSFLVVLTDDSGGRAFPVWLNGPEGHGLFRGRENHPTPSLPRRSPPTCCAPQARPTPGTRPHIGMISHRD
jgi:hypothetical protein